VRATGPVGASARASSSSRAAQQASGIGASITANVHPEGEREFRFEVQIHGGRIVVSTGNADSFISGVLPQKGLEGQFDLTVGWSNLKGIYFGGSADLVVTIPLNASLGPVGLSAFHVNASVNPNPVALHAAFALDAFAPGAAAELFDRAEEAAHRLGLEVPMDVLRGRGRALELLGDFGRSRTDLEKAATLATATGDQSLISATQLDLGWLWSSRDYEPAGAYFHAALDAARAGTDRGLVARTLNRVGNWHLTAEHPEEAIRLHLQALELFRESDDAHGVAQSQDLLGTVELTLGDMGQATRWYLAAVEGFGGLGDREGMASALSMLSFCGLQYLNAPFGAAGLDFADRVARARQALEITQAISWRSGQTLSTIALANLLGYHGSYREATAYVNRCLALAEELHHHYWRTLANLVRGAIRLDLLETEAAVSSLETAFQLAREANSDYWARITSGYLVPALLELGRVDRAREIVDTHLDPDAIDEFVATSVFQFLDALLRQEIRDRVVGFDSP
jgi:tetratricopeptide (TPR) repeat protein